MRVVAIAAILIHAAVAAPMLILNEDNSHFYMSRTANDMTVDGLNAFVDQYADTQVTHLFLNASAMRASYASDVWDRIWEVSDQEVPKDIAVAQVWVDNARLLHERGLDPYAVWIARCREIGIAPWISMRMNDVHDVDNPKNFMHSTFWVNHPEYWRVPGSSGAWVDRAFNYAIPEVREHHMALIRELLERYDADGVELDWMRFGYHFAPGEEEAGRAILTDFMRDVRALATEWSAKRGHPIQVCARVPAHPDAAVGLGMDGIAWAKEGLIDILVPTPFWATADYDIPVELWRERLGDADASVVVVPGQEVLVRAYPGGPAITNDLASVRGFAASAWHRGAEGLYLFNYMDPAPMADGVDGYRRLIEEGLAEPALAGKPRRHVVTYRDTVPASVSNNAQLPRPAGEASEFRIHTGPIPENGAAILIVGLAEADAIDDVVLRVTANEAPCDPAADIAATAIMAGVVRALSFTCPLPALEAGYNTFRVAPEIAAAGQQIVWAELRFDSE
jgi:hypothetical protein